MKSIVIFNNKGGVGKTTLLCNLASFLQIKEKKKVLVIDADPQCNATSYIIPYPSIEDLYDRDEGTIYDIIKPLQRGKGFLKTPLPIIKSPRFEVDVIPGDPKLSLAEDFLSNDWGDAKGGNARGLQTTLVFKEALSRLHEYDFVIFDVGPSLGALNRAILLACDFFLVPMSSDIFSLRAIDNIALALNEWGENFLDGLEEFKKKEKEAFQIDDRDVNWSLKFVGYVTQQYTAKTVNSEKRPVKAYEKIIKKIPAKVKSELGPFNKNYSLIKSKLGEIPSLHSLIPLSQNANCPIFKLVAADGVVGAHFNKVRDYEEVMNAISSNLQHNLAVS